MPPSDIPRAHSRNAVRAASPNGNRLARASSSWVELEGKLRRTTEATVLRIAALRELLARRDDQRSIELCDRAADRAAAIMLVDALQPIDQGERVVLGVAAPRGERLVHRAQCLAEARLAELRDRRKIRAEKVRSPIRQAKRRQRPAAALAHHLDRVHEDRVDIGSLFAVDLDVDEQLVHHRRGRRVLERFVRHHVAPVARRVADRHEDRFIEPRRFGKRSLPPRPPLDRIFGVLPEIR